MGEMAVKFFAKIFQNFFSQKSRCCGFKFDNALDML